ncbi:MAG: hypothetical protein ACD_56C00146G0026 [uncultured bacterium]|nr:MAG: hypothetical protein ACD_56C00146G0026 [uncultured bacterium]
MLLPRFRRLQNPELEKFIIRNINEEIVKIKNDEHCDLIQMQYFLESAFCGKQKSIIYSPNDVTGK